MIGHYVLPNTTIIVTVSCMTVIVLLSAMLVYILLAATLYPRCLPPFPLPLDNSCFLQHCVLNLPVVGDHNYFSQ